MCPPDGAHPSTRLCRFGTGPCDPTDFCDGVSAACPPNARSPAGTVCRGPATSCDAAETCDGLSAQCPLDALDIRRVQAGGGGAQRISYGQGTYSTPVWSPMGDLIAFTRQSGGQFHIGIMNPDGSGERLLASSFHMEGPSFCPNGRVIMYFSDPGGDSGPSLYSVDIWGRNNQRVATESFASDPSWSSRRS